MRHDVPLVFRVRHFHSGNQIDNHPHLLSLSRCCARQARADHKCAGARECLDHVVNPLPLSGQATRPTPLGSSGPCTLLWKKTCRLPRRKRRAVWPPERNACRQRPRQLEVGVSLAFILARVAAWARNIIRRRGSNPVRWPAMRQLQYGQLVESTLGQSPRARCARSGQRPVRRGPHVPQQELFLIGLNAKLARASLMSAC
jgi:hypothetical protein